MCQCPTAGFFHFYLGSRRNFCKVFGIVSMPYSGLLPFLRTSGQEKRIFAGRVSMPYSGLLPFLPQKLLKVSTSCPKVSMPYSGLLPFLLQDYWASVDDVFLCQCPTAGFFHFYPDLWNPLILRGCRSQFCKPISVSVKKRVKMTIFLVFRKNSLFTSVIYHLSKWLYFLLKHLYYNTFFYHLHYYSSFFLIFVVLS